ncbi:hypothetical protein Nmel_011814 [Mimus melanotis]
MRRNFSGNLMRLPWAFQSMRKDNFRASIQRKCCITHRVSLDPG